MCERVRVKVVMTATTVPTTRKNGVPPQKAIVTCHLDQKKVQTIVSTQEMLSVCQNKATSRPRNRVTGNQSVWSNIFADVGPLFYLSKLLFAAKVRWKMNVGTNDIFQYLLICQHSL